MKKGLLYLLLGFLILQIPMTNSALSDTETSSTNQFTAGTWEPSPSPDPSSAHVVINEVYYDVAPDKGTENKNEWIELYNNTDSPVSLKDWSLVDAAGNIKIIHPEISIPAKGFIVLSHDGSTWSSYWTLPAGVDFINLTGSSAWLNNDGDKLTLKDAGGNEIDWVAWEGFVSGWDLNAPEGQSIARVTKGVDTDLPSDWHVLTTPNPGTNPHPPESAQGSGSNPEEEASSSAVPSPEPTPTPDPSPLPSSEPSVLPSSEPSVLPSSEPSVLPSSEPSASPSPSE